MQQSALELHAYICPSSAHLNFSSRQQILIHPPDPEREGWLAESPKARLHLRPHLRHCSKPHLRCDHTAEFLPSHLRLDGWYS
eukprot:3563531-Amphidinium_carterae.1